MNNKKKIFITGISSEIMQRFCSLIDRDQYEITGLSRDPRKIKIKAIKIIEGDILDPSKYSSIAAASDMIIHAAAETHSFKKEKYQKVNVEGTKQLISAISGKNTEFVYISSNTASKNGGAYAESKLSAEEYIRANTAKWKILRLSEIFGGNKKEGVEKLIEDVYYGSFLPVPQGMNYKFRPIYIDDAVQIMFDKIFNSDAGNAFCNINGNKEYTFAELVDSIAKASGTKVKLIPLHKNILEFIKKAVSFIPFYVGIIPDQIDRLYGDKSYEKQPFTLMTIEQYASRKFSEAGRNL